MKTECDAVFLFIAELTGSFTPGSGDVNTKLECGQADYINHNLHDLDLESEEDRADLHENIWLERLYDELDEYFRLQKGSTIGRHLSVHLGTCYREESYKWAVPIELDASALA